MIYVDMTIEVKIDSLEIAHVLNEVSSQLSMQSNQNEINYIVTTKGCPSFLNITWSQTTERAFEGFLTDFVVVTNGIPSSFKKPVPFAETGTRIV